MIVETGAISGTSCRHFLPKKKPSGTAWASYHHPVNGLDPLSHSKSISTVSSNSHRRPLGRENTHPPNSASGFTSPFMAPRKRTKNQEEDLVVEKPAPATSRLTRSSARLAANSKADLTVTELPKSKKAKRAPKENGKVEEVENKEVKVDVGLGKLDKDAKSRTVVIEHCKQCQSFKKRAIQVQTGLENGVPGITVLLNPDKPRRGCFEIRSEDGEKFISLLDMKRPFTRMKELNMDEVISDIIEKIKG
ncbi:hypothetical protein Csa_022241 [Cucumis sativus]|nr:hypothetical protein Csa_022241 [Cucumis sativus]